MRFFRRRRSGRGHAEQPPDPRTAWPRQHVPDDPVAAAERFWQRWAELLPHISSALGENEPQRVEHELCETVALLHPRLQFSLDRGRQAIYALVLSGQEDPELRPYTDAWIAAAPATDAIWEYHDSVPPVPDPTEVTVTLGGQRIALADVRILADPDEREGVVDVGVHHPLLSELDAESRSAVTFLSLDVTLGERLAARCLRRVEPAETEPVGAIGLPEVRELVERLSRREGPGDGGE